MKAEDRAKKLLDEGFKAYVLYCPRNEEENVSKKINDLFEECYASPVYKVVHKSKNGIKYDAKDILLDRYVFLYTTNDYDIEEIKGKIEKIKLLSKNELIEEDYSYVKFALENNCVLGLSKAVKIDRKVKILDGPLKHFEGYIKEYSSRNRNCRVEIDFINQKINTWLPFEYVDIAYKDIEI